MKRILMWFFSTVTGLVLLLGYHTSSASPTAVTPAPSPADTAPASPAVRGSAGNGTVTGPVVQTEWGPVQVQLAIRAGRITDVAVLQHPTGNPSSDQINAYALPILVQETLSAQSANIDMVSGATVTSGGYLASLQAALDEARL